LKEKNNMFDAFKIFRRKLKVLRKGTGNFNSGIWEYDGQEEVINITASVQGTNAEILQTLPEGTRINSTYLLRTSFKLSTGKIGESTPDIVLIDGEEFIVIRVTAHKNLQQTKHYEAVVVGDNKDEN